MLRIDVAQVRRAPNHGASLEHPSPRARRLPGRYGASRRSDQAPDACTVRVSKLEIELHQAEYAVHDLACTALIGGIVPVDRLLHGHLQLREHPLARSEEKPTCWDESYAC